MCAIDHVGLFRFEGDEDIVFLGDCGKCGHSGHHIAPGFGSVIVGMLAPHVFRVACTGADAENVCAEGSGVADEKFEAVKTALTFGGVGMNNVIGRGENGDCDPFSVRTRAEFRETECQH